MSEVEKSLITIINENKKGMLSKITGYCGENNINIEKLIISNFRTDNLLHKIVMYVTGDRARISGLIDGFKSIDGIVSASNFISSNYIEREMMLLKVNANSPNIDQINQIAVENFATIILKRNDIIIFQFIDTDTSIENICGKIEKIPNAVYEVSKTGVIATSLDKLEEKNIEDEEMSFV